MDARQDIDFLVLLVQQTLQIPDFRFQRSHALLQRFRVSSGKGATAEFVAGFALETDVGALRAAWPNAVATDLFTSAAITGLGDTALGGVADLDHFHRKNAGHFG